MIEEKIELIRIGETYLKFDFDYTKENKKRIATAYLNQISPISREFLRNRDYIKIAIEFEQGSLKTRIVILGSTLFSLYIGIGQYGSFKAGIRELIADMNWFSENAIERIDNGPDINQNNIIRTEKRTGLTGRIQELYNRIDRFEKTLNKMSHQTIQNELNQIKQEVSNIATVLSEYDECMFLLELNADYSESLPNPNPRRVNYLIKRYCLKPEDEIEFV